MGTGGRTSRSQCGHGIGAARLATSILRIAGNVMRSSGPLRLRFIFATPHLLQECKRNHREDRVVVKPVPRTAFEVIEAEFLLELLVGLLAGPTGLDARSDGFERSAWRQVAQVIPRFVGSLFSHEPGFVAGKMNAVLGARTVTDANAHRGELAAQRALGPASPRNRAKRPSAEFRDPLLGRDCPLIRDPARSWPSRTRAVLRPLGTRIDR